VFIKGTLRNGLTITTYVDDMKIIGNVKAAIQGLKDQLSSVFRITDLRPISYYLGMKVIRDRAKRTINLL